MTITEALNILDDVQVNLNQPLLETLMIMGDSPDDFTEQEIAAYRRAMIDFRKLFAPAGDNNV